MFAIIGIPVVLGAVVGGYLMEHGKLLVLMQPAELIIIGGAAAGTLLIANPMSTVIAIVKGMLGVLKGSPYSGSASTGTGETVSVSKDDMAELKDKLEQAMKKSPEFEKLKDYIQMSVTGEGLRVEMLESEDGIFFKSGSGRPTETGHDLILRLGEELKKLPNDLMIEGHTDAKPFSKGGDYSNWELSTDRANAARRLMEGNGLAHGRVVQVRGFGDQSLHDKANPEAASNRRISVIVRYQDAPDPEPPPATSGAKPAEKAHR